MKDHVKPDSPRGVPDHERHLYSLTRAFGRFGMRIFEPQEMDSPHWHGHIEINVLTGATMDYDVDGSVLTIPEGRAVVFWAGVPHQLIRIAPTGTATPSLANIYVPLDAFLYYAHVAEMQVALIGGAVLMLPEYVDLNARIETWYQDYRTKNFERRDLLRMELNAFLRRGSLDGYEFLLEPGTRQDTAGKTTPGQTRHVVAMLRHVLENLEHPMTNADVTAVTGLHANYALTLFSRTMRMPVKRFIVRMRLIRARAILLETSLPVARVVELSGFSSTTQFYHHFKAAYGTSPHALRQQAIGSGGQRGSAA